MQSTATKSSRGGSLAGNAAAPRSRLAPPAAAKAPSTSSATTPVPRTTSNAATGAVKQSITTCVRVRPVASSAASGEQDESPWLFDTKQHVVTQTRHHPSLAKHDTSSTAQSGLGPRKLGALASGDGKAGKVLRFDSLVGPQDDAQSMHAAHISPIVHAAVEGYNGTIFAYGQSGSGKTYTMEGGRGQVGVIGRALDEIWARKEKVSELLRDTPCASPDTFTSQDTKRFYSLHVSYLEIYKETLSDLLAPLPWAPTSSLSASDGSASPVKGGSKSTLCVREASDRVWVEGLREEVVTSPKDVLDLIKAGQAQRRTEETERNAHSSRSHSILTISIHSRATSGGDQEMRVSSLSLIDLAGSESASADSERRKEGAFVSSAATTY